MSLTDVFWVYAKRKGPIKPPTERSGKWLIFIKKTEADAFWESIARATSEGRLGSSAKCGTARENPNALDQGKTVVCVYTPDFDDMEDVMRVRSALRDLGVSWKIPYKLDSATMAGRYAVRGDARTSALWV